MSELGSEWSAADPITSASADPNVVEKATNQGDAGQTRNSSKSAESDRVEDTGDTAGFAAQGNTI